MNPHCKHIREYLSAYLDGALNESAITVATHLDCCSSCHQEFAAWRSMQSRLALLGRVKAPANLAQRLRLAIANERALQQRRLFEGLTSLWSDSISPVFYRAAAGMASTAVLMGVLCLLLTAISTPTLLVADDQPIGNATSPQYLYSSVQPQTLHMDHDDNLLVEAYVNTQGHIYDYRILSGPDTPEIRTSINDRLLFSVYQPAQFFGQPVRGHVLISFAGISVHG